jgi:hypothetical protein
MINRHPVLTVLGWGDFHSMHGSPRRSDPTRDACFTNKEKKE